MDEVQSKRESVLITKRGKPVAKLVPADKDTDDFYGFLPVRAGSQVTSSLSHLLQKNGAIYFDSVGYARCHLDRHGPG
jgi:hypothetical protein